MALVLGSGCAHQVYSSKLTAAAPPRGVVYALPKTVLKVTIPYTVRETSRMVNGYASSPLQEVLVQKPVVIETKSVADLVNTFVLSGDDLNDDVLLEAELEFKVNDNGLLEGVSADSSDNTLKAVQSSVSAGISVAKTLAVAAGMEPPELTAALRRIKQIYREIGELVAFDPIPVVASPEVPSGVDVRVPETPGAKTPRLEPATAPAKAVARKSIVERTLEVKRRQGLIQALTQELEKLQAVVQTYQDKNKDVVKETELAYTLTVDPDSFDKSKADWTYEIAPDELVKGIKSAEMPKVTLVLKGAGAQTTQVNGGWKPQDRNPGFIYRATATLQLLVQVDNTDVLQDWVSIPQLGHFASASVESKRFTTRKTSATFNGSGALKEYKVKTGSSADKVAEAVASSLDSVQKSLLDLRYGLKIEDLQKQKELADAKKALEPGPGQSDAEKTIADLKEQTQLTQAKLALEQAQLDLEKLRTENK
ncbi:hypothetical protein [Corallococcus caeni]